MKIMVNARTIELVQGDITDMDTEAIVNAANEHLAHGGGVAAAIARRGGEAIWAESREWIQNHGRVTTGSAAITSGGHLKARFVIHAVGPVMGSGDEEAKLQSATMSALALAEQHGLKSIAFPAISTGIFGFPVERCARIMLDAVRRHLCNDVLLQRVVFCLFDRATYTSFERQLTVAQKG
ncbi:macro domain-containing protein [candidate division KSB1 bacterium]|nr:macro domain-containing protein [candidate division KSB1 bacterium]RQW02321.1 MAG: macro domain-containing protein [candidate division KSB1 bacterium]